jgi:hypothetical protein
LLEQVAKPRAKEVVVVDEQDPGLVVGGFACLAHAVPAANSSWDEYFGIHLVRPDRQGLPREAGGASGYKKVIVTVREKDAASEQEATQTSMWAPETPPPTSAATPSP